jgi:hypothetical protein
MSRSSSTPPRATASRDRLLGFVAGRGIENVVVLTGDVHNHDLADLRRDFEDPRSPVLGTELVCTSIASGGDGSDRSGAYERLLPENPHLRYTSNRRGYVSCRLDAATYRADFRVLDHVRMPGAPARTDASFVIEAGARGHSRPDGGRDSARQWGPWEGFGTPHCRARPGAAYAAPIRQARSTSWRTVVPSASVTVTRSDANPPSAAGTCAVSTSPDGVTGTGRQLAPSSNDTSAVAVNPPGPVPPAG